MGKLILRFPELCGLSLFPINMHRFDVVGALQQSSITVNLFWTFKQELTESHRMFDYSKDRFDC